MIGIYRIKNLVNGKCYYGSSKQIEKRWKTHLNQLKNKKHINFILQNAWNKYGEENFIFEVVEECELEKLFETEQKYIDNCGDYNIGLKASGGDNISKNPNKNLIIENIKKGSKLWRDSLSNNERRERFSKPLDKNPNWKGGSSFIYCEICNKKIKQGSRRCREHIEFKRTGINNPFYGKQHTEKTKKKLSEKIKGQYNGEQNIPIIIDDVEYRSYGDASKKLGVPVPTIRWRCLSKNPKYKNYHHKDGIKETYTEEEQKKRFSESQKGKQTNFNRPFFIDDVEFRTLMDASKKLNIHPMTIKGRLKSPKFDNYRYKD